MKKLIMTFALALATTVGQAVVVINELMADNGGAYPNAAGEAMDWVELYNAGSSPVDLTGWRITDTVEDKWSKWKEIPAGTIVPAQGYLLLWGHNKDFPTPTDEKGFCGVTNGEVHVKLGMSSKGETITLAASEADYDAKAFADQATFGAQFANVSYGRNPAGTAKWLFFTNATPGAANGTDGLVKYPPDEEPGGGDEPSAASDNTELEDRLLAIGLPVVVIDTVDKEEPTCEIVGNTLSKDNTKVPGRVRIKTLSGTEYDSGFYEKKKSGMTVKYRGNGSARQDKKPYKIKLQSPADLLARGDDGHYRSKDWVLLASVNTLKNCFGFLINEIVGLPWTPGYRYANLVFNGDYRGLFMIVESVERDEKCRVNISEDGYLYELDLYWWNEDFSIRTADCGEQEGYSFKYPDVEDMTPEKVMSISNTIVRVEQAVVDGTYPVVIDVSTWSSWLLGQDILGNADGTGSNLYYTKYDDKPETKVCMTTMWDFDAVQGMWGQWSNVHELEDFPYIKLVGSDNHAFNNAYVRKWLEVRSQIVPRVEAMLETMGTSGLLEAINDSRILDGERWGSTRNTIDESIRSVRQWCNNRVSWLDGQIKQMSTDPWYGIFINELNVNEGWIELYNAGDRSVDVSGWRLSDKMGDNAWQKGEALPAGTAVPAGGYLIVRFDEFTDRANGEAHVNFSFSSKSDAVVLLRKEDAVVDSIALAPQHQGASFGRNPSDLSKFVYFRTPTPGAANGDEGRETLVFTIDFHPGKGGEGTMAAQTMTYDVPEALCSNAFHRVGYTFLGWTDDENEIDEVLYYDGVVVSNLTDEADGECDLYAVWAANAYAVRFDAKGGSGTMEDQPFLYDEVRPLDANLFTKEHYLFAGWIIRGDTNNTVFADEEAVSNLTAEADGEVVLCALWELDGWRTILGKQETIETGLIGYRASGLPKGLTYNKTTGRLTGTAKESGEFVATFTRGGGEIRKVIAVRAEEVFVGCEGLTSGPLPAGVVDASGGLDLQTFCEGGVKSMSITGLPVGMKYDSKSGKITGAPSTAGDYEVVLTMTTKYGTKKTVKIPVSVTEMPEMVVGTFNGFVSVGNDTHGTFTLTTTDAGKLTAKVITAAGTVSFSGTSWDSVEKGVYRTTLTAKKGERLVLNLNSTTAWDENQLFGEFTTASVAYSVSAQRNAFGQAWYFSATGDVETGWTFAYAEDAKIAALTVTLKADGTASIVGKLPNGADSNGKGATLSVAASGYANVGWMKNGAILADFAPILTVNKAKKMLVIRTNLWFDRSNDHVDKENEGVGGARFVE